ncbi:hypothetical protein FOL47_010767 [Perkinsus chesapeaki]|uniref:Secreted protein n=1 Tax=Perkinsus chesapeaki TaxID=330153 RepID=A0A7J6L0M3_PERCH|nr:hypothetical protein FOL47_010767 [Perkinsus chesapeaki]
MFSTPVLVLLCVIGTLNARVYGVLFERGPNKLVILCPDDGSPATVTIPGVPSYTVATRMSRSNRNGVVKFTLLWSSEERTSSTAQLNRVRILPTRVPSDGLREVEFRGTRAWLRIGSSRFTRLQLDADEVMGWYTRLSHEE